MEEKMKKQAQDQTENLKDRNAELEKQVTAELKRDENSLKAQEKVKIRIPRMPDSRDDVVECGVNGHMYCIKRGETVEVPVSVKLVLENCGIL